MTCRRLPVLLSLLLGFLVLSAAWAQQPRAGRQKKEPAPDTAALKARIAELETQIAKMNSELRHVLAVVKDPAVSPQVAALDAQIANLTKELQSVRAVAKASAPSPQLAGKNPVAVFPLKYAKATSIAKALQDLLQGMDGVTLRIATEPSLNTLLVLGSPEELAVVEAVITRLEAVAQNQAAPKPVQQDKEKLP
jgi:type II secretory pathway component GspD/PulD (secretin)